MKPLIRLRLLLTAAAGVHDVEQAIAVAVPSARGSMSFASHNPTALRIPKVILKG
ncbi:MAG: hypothetical protein ABMA01_03240 [Chthoniobacteraceae bacterium]